MAIRRLHAAGIEVILDVVYNHTCETRETGPTLCWRGLDNASYYRLRENDPRHYVDDTGTGNTVNLSNPHVLQMAMDSLRYWARSFHVDGFRFDLSVTLGREDHGFDSGSGFFDALRQDPELSQLKLIAEPWDMGSDGYRLGHHPPGFAEWNDKYRDAVRRYWRGDSGMRPEVARRLSGSADLFGRDSVRKPWASVNFVASHDGMTLQDIVSYSRKHNEANKEGNADGAPENWSSNWGEEGPSHDAQRLALRERVKRSMLLTLFASIGTPMLLAGDECGRTQRGNNNPYCQDNETSWLDWKLARNARPIGFDRFRGETDRNPPRASRVSATSIPPWPSPDCTGCARHRLAGRAGRRLSPDDWDNQSGRALMMALAGDGAGQPELVFVLMNASDTPLGLIICPATSAGACSSTAPYQKRCRRKLTGKTYQLAGSCGRDCHYHSWDRGRISRNNAVCLSLRTGSGRTESTCAFACGLHRLSGRSLRIDGLTDQIMTCSADGWHEAMAECGAGARYKFGIGDIAVTDPASRMQDGDVHDWSVVTDPSSVRMAARRLDRAGPGRDDSVRMHPGLFGGFTGIQTHLERLANLGITAIELMPIADFPGERNWGYDGVLPSRRIAPTERRTN